MGAHEPGDPDRIAADDGHDEIGGGQRRVRGGVAARAVEVADDLLVAFERRGDVHDDVVHPGAAVVERGTHPRGGELGPAAGTVQSRQHLDLAERHRDARQLRHGQRAPLGAAARRGEPGALVGEPGQHRDRRRVRVGVDERDAASVACQLARQLDRDRRAPGGSGRPPHREDAAPGGRRFGRRCGSDDGRRRLVGIRRHNAEHLRQAALCRIRADGDDPHTEAVAGRHELRGEGPPGRGDGERVGAGQLSEQLGGGAARHRVGGGRSGGRCRDHEPHIDVLPPQPLRQPVADGTVARDDHSHGVVPDDGTTERLEPSATAASAAATSAREITSSTAVPAEPIMLSSRSTDTTVADATRMRGVS